MLSPRENLIETIHGGKPDRYVKQFEFFDVDCLFADPWNMSSEVPFFPGAPDGKDMWGITWTWPEGILGTFPVHDEAHRVLKDITEWERVLKAPPLEYPDEMWEAARAAYDAVDRTQFFAGPMVSPGIFETLHSLMGMDDAMVAFLEEPEAMHELIDFIIEWECAYVREMAVNLHFDAVLHHDDWGSRTATFLSPAMFREFLLEPYRKLYACYRSNGVGLIVHHSDSFAATLVPDMIEVGIDIWQGGVGSNDLRKVIDTYGDQITIMSGIESAEVDTVDWTPEAVEAAVREACTAYGTRYYIPCATQGGPLSSFEGVYGAVDAAIDAVSKETFK